METYEKQGVELVYSSPSKNGNAGYINHQMRGADKMLEDFNLIYRLGNPKLQ